MAEEDEEALNLVEVEAQANGSPNWVALQYRHGTVLAWAAALGVQVGDLW